MASTFYILICILCMGCGVYFFVSFLKGVINELKSDPKPHFSDICIDLIPCFGSIVAFILALIVILQTISAM